MKQARRSFFIFLLMAYLSVCCWVKSASLSPNGHPSRENVVVLSTNYDVAVGLDPSLWYLFVLENNENVDDKNRLVKMSSRQYYHGTKFNWNKGKQQWSYKRHQEWLDYSSNMPSPMTSKLEELQSYPKYALNGLEMALQLHVTIPFQKWIFNMCIYKQKTFEKILKSITIK